jgi:ABC-type sugar transport system permease subunit
LEQPRLDNEGGSWMPVPATPDSGRRLYKKWNAYKYPLLFLAPWVIGLFVFSVYPIISSLYLSFTNFNLFKSPDLIGLEN